MKYEVLKDEEIPGNFPIIKDPHVTYAYRGHVIVHLTKIDKWMPLVFWLAWWGINLDTSRSPYGKAVLYNTAKDAEAVMDAIRQTLQHGRTVKTEFGDVEEVVGETVYDIEGNVVSDWNNEELDKELDNMSLGKKRFDL